MKIDPHIHTKYSGHSLLSPKLVKKICMKKGLEKIAVVDHNTIKGALELKKIFDVIVGEEIKTDRGEVIGLFLQEEIEPGPLPQVLDDIRDQDGVIYVPHPFDRLRSGSVNDNSFVEYADIVEVFNARTIYDEDNKKAGKIADENNMIKASGSDAHTRFEIGNAYMKMKDFNSKPDFMKNVPDAELFGERSPIWVHAFTKFLKLVR